MGRLRWCSTNMERVSRLLDDAVRDGSPLMLAKVLDPRLDHEGFDVTSRVGSVMEHAPLDGSVSPPHAAKGMKRFHEATPLLGINTVLNGYQDRSFVYPCLDLHSRLRPMQGRPQVEADPTRHAPAEGRRQPANEGGSISDERRAGPGSCREGTPEHTPQRQPALEDEQVGAQRTSADPGRCRVLGCRVEAGHEQDPSHSPRHQHRGEGHHIAEQRQCSSHKREYQCRPDEHLIEGVLPTHTLQYRRTADGTKSDAAQQETKSPCPEAKVLPRQGWQERPGRAAGNDENPGADQDSSDFRRIPYVTQPGPSGAEHSLSRQHAFSELGGPAV